MQTYNRDTLLNDLRTNVVEVTFTKAKTNEIRVMRCTLMPQYLPKTYVEESDQESEFHKKNENVIACWDVQKGGWRSFRIDSVTWCQNIEGY
jgi:hypothetical protein